MTYQDTENLGVLMTYLEKGFNDLFRERVLMTYLKEGVLMTYTKERC